MNKINILTVDDVKIGKLRWWTNWIDISVFDYAGGYLLQMKISRVNGKKFRAVSYKSIIGLAHATIAEAGDLIQMKSGEQQ